MENIIQNSNWGLGHSTNARQIHFQSPSFDYERYEQLKKCFDHRMNKTEEDEEIIDKSIFPTIKQITVDFDIPLTPLKPIK